ncbi:hydrophobic surface binding protein A domain-containing protein [Hirsutella rhossiliensis]
MRQNASQSLAADVDVAINSGIAAKPKVDKLIIPIKPAILVVLKSSQAGFSALSKIYLADVPAEKKNASQAFFNKINDSLENCYKAYQS